MQKKKRIDSLQILRAVGFLEIFLGHAGVSFFTGAFGVSMFVVLSGFCLTINYLPKIDQQNVSVIGNLKFAVSRIKKLYLLHLIMLLIKYVLSNMPTSSLAIRRILLNVFLVQSWSPYAEDYFSYNGVAWYLSTYLFICFFAPWLIKGLSGIKKKETIAATGIFVYFAMILIGVLAFKRPLNFGDSFPYWLTYIFPFYRLLDFSLGALLGWLYLNTSHKERWNFGISTILEIFTIILFIAVVKIFHRIEGVYDGLCYTALFAPVSLWLVIMFLKSKGAVMKLLSNPLFTWIGNLSSYTFLIHQIVIYQMMKILSEDFSGTPYRILVILTSFLISMTSAQLIVFVNRIFEKRKLKESKGE